VFRIAQEAVSNALKHGRVRNIEIRLEQTGAEILLRIEDDGGGFEPPLAGGRGMGLNVMHHRARIIGATIDIDPGPGRGVVVQCRLPQIRA
jgi:signal transduction histidine kinase